MGFGVGQVGFAEWCCGCFGSRDCVRAHRGLRLGAWGLVWGLGGFVRAGFGLGWEGFWVEADGFWGVDFVFGEGQLGFGGLVGYTGARGVVFGDQGFLFVVGRADFGLGRAWTSWFWAWVR